METDDTVTDQITDDFLEILDEKFPDADIDEVLSALATVSVAQIKATFDGIEAEYIFTQLVRALIDGWAESDPTWNMTHDPSMN